MQDPLTSNQDLQKVIGLDPGFTMDIYRSFGASFAGKRGPASDVAHAISLLGPLPVKIAAKNLPTLDKTLPETARIGIYQCYSRAIHASIYARHIGELRNDKNPDEMGHAALLHNCGEMALWAHAGKPMSEIFKLVQKGADWGSASSSVLGFSLKRLNVELAKSWNLSPFLIETMDHTWREYSRPMAVQLACSIARESAAGWNSGEVEELIELLSDYTQHKRERTTAFIHTLAAQADRQLFGLPLPASTFNMLRQPPVTIHYEEKKPEKGSIEIIPIKRQKRPMRVEIEAPPPKPKKAEKRPSLTELLKQMPREPRKEARPIQVKRFDDDELAASKTVLKPKVKVPGQAATGTKTEKTAPIKEAATEARPDIADGPGLPKVMQKAKAPMPWEESLSRYIRKMRNDLGLKQVMFALVSPNKKYAKVSELKGADAGSGLNNFIVNIEEQNLFNLLLAKQQGFWLKPDNREKFLPLIPKNLHDSIDVNGFYCMSIFVRGEAVGFIYADGQYVLNEDSYADFKQLCAELSLDLGQISR